jgi:hypothetical protein
MTGYEIDRTLIDAFVAGTVDPRGEASLAEQVARILPFHWTMPNPIAAALSRISNHLGGEQALFDWLDRHPGRPRVVARLYGVIGLLDRYSDVPAMVTALRELREQTPYPPGLAGYLVPDSTPDTLAELGAQIESLLIQERVDEAVQLALAAITMLQGMSPRATELDSKVGELGDLLEQARQSLVAAAGQTA